MSAAALPGGASFAAVAGRYAVLGVVVGLILAAAGPLALGYKSFTVMSGSMAPAIHTGDVVVDETIPPREARVGDIVTFHDPQDHARLVTHRVQGVRARGDSFDFVTKGDANNNVERWSVPADGRIGRVSYRIWQLGYVLFWVRTPVGRLALVVLPALLLGGWAVVRIWRTGRDEAAAG